MNGVVIALVLLIFLLVVGAVIYFSTQEEEEEKDIDDEYIPVEVITETPVVDESEVDTFDIVNGWLYDTTYSKMIGIGDDGKLKISEYNSDEPDQRSKWTFEPTGTSFYVLDQVGKALKITGSDIQLGNKSGSAKIKIVPHEDGYKLSSNSGRNWIKIEGSAIDSTKEQSEASTFIIDPSQYYIKSFETDKFKSNKHIAGDEGNKGLIESLTNFDVKCDTGVLSGFGLVKDGSKYKYNYGCVEGDSTAGDLNETTLLDTSELTNISHFHGAEAGEPSVAKGFIVNCDRDGSGGGALARFKLLKGDDNKASYEYTCRDVSTTGDDIVTLSDQNVDNNHTYSENAESVEPIVQMGSLNCNQGEVLTGFKYIHDAQDQVGLSGICKKLAA